MIRRAELIPLVLALLLAATPSFAQDDAAAEGPFLIVGTKQAVPFAFRDERGEWKGISIDLWRETADQLGIRYELRESDLDGLLGGVADGSFDAAVAAITITADREATIDFTHPFYSTGLGIAVPTRGASWLSSIRALASPQFLGIVGILTLLLLIVGFLVWLAERKRNEQFGGGVAEGVGSGFWWSAVTMTTVGYGDKAPITPAGRVLALIWMFVSLVAISSFTAAIASALTVGRLDTPVKSPADLADVSVGTVASSTSSKFLENKRIQARTFTTVDDALATLAAGEIDAVVYDAPILQYLAAENHAGEIRVLGRTFQRQDYGIALPSGSPLREPLNRAILRVVRDPMWDDILFEYLGE